MRYHIFGDELSTEKDYFRACAGGSEVRMMIPNTCPNLSNIVLTDFGSGRVTQTVIAADPGITARGWVGEIRLARPARHG